jgi:hypothetical protein
MMESKVLDLLKSKIEEHRKRIVESLGDGVAKDYADYQNKCGVILGLLTALAEINDLAQKLKDNDE